jgi:hypothetical protein
MDKSLNKEGHTNPEMNTDKNPYKIEEQQDVNTINTLDNQPVNNISNDEQVCIYNLSTHQSRDKFNSRIQISRNDDSSKGINSIPFQRFLNHF